MVYKFKIKIEGLSKPPVWRKVEVPSTFDFLQFHNIIQTVFGWQDYHLFNFEPRTKRRESPAFRIEQPFDEGAEIWDDAEILVASETTLDMIFPSFGELVYTYDYGDDWTHSVKLEGVVNERRDYAVCTGGKGTTPPEDCGGIWGYYRLKEAFAESEFSLKKYLNFLSLGFRLGRTASLQSL